ncbi:MAG: 23S rRNA (uracil(1939)-C(5))-methyltransferase RlmD [Bacilli bacterium]|jgi:23S rRNA (uracil1939-C5)-methyltransferase|nr:23S rRNA (uracil(1939)-C(5))-methyltransferase RlmD [Bacilli bacterium]
MDPLIKQILHLNCVDLSYEGRGFCRDLNDNVILVNYLFPGEEALVEVDYKRAGLYYGHIKKLEKESPERIKPLCPFSFRCGGCEFQSLSYKSQLAFKSKLVKDQLKKIAHLDVDAKETIGMDDPYYYRNKIQMPFALDKDGHVVYGFYKEGSHEVVPISNCVIEDKRANLIIGEIKTAMDELGVLPYDETTRKGYIRHAIVRTSYVYKEVMLILVSAKEGFPEQDALLQKIVSNCPELTSVYLNVNSSFGSKIMGEKNVLLYGESHIKDSLCGLDFIISPSSFYQTNPVMTSILYQKAMEGASLKKDDVVLDAYSGTGTIGLVAAKYVSKVIGVEINRDAVTDALANAKSNKIDNYEAYVDDASNFIERMAKEGKRLDVVFMDPPRKGSDERFLSSLLKMKPDRIVYISCNPLSLARDLAFIKDAYDVEDVQPVDLFPETGHVETVVRLTLRDDK